jgi:hypothetical protein
MSAGCVKSPRLKRRPFINSKETNNECHAGSSASKRVHGHRWDRGSRLLPESAPRSQLRRGLAQAPRQDPRLTTRKHRAVRDESCPRLIEKDRGRRLLLRNGSILHWERPKVQGRHEHTRVHGRPDHDFDCLELPSFRRVSLMILTTSDSVIPRAVAFSRYFPMSASRRSVW